MMHLSTESSVVNFTAKSAGCGITTSATVLDIIFCDLRDYNVQGRRVGFFVSPEEPLRKRSTTKPVSRPTVASQATHVSDANQKQRCHVEQVYNTFVRQRIGNILSDEKTEMGLENYYMESICSEAMRLVRDSDVYNLTVLVRNSTRQNRTADLRFAMFF